MAEDKPQRRFNIKGCIRFIVILIKFLLIVGILVGAGVAGAFIATQIANRTNTELNDRVNQLSTRESELALTVNDLETENNKLKTDNAELRNQLNIETDKLKNRQRVDFVSTELGKRLRTFEIKTPPFYFEYDREYGNVTARAFPAEFAEDVIAEGIEISFEKSNITITVEPWKFSGRSLEKVQELAVNTANGKKMTLTVLQDKDNKFVVQAILDAQNNKADTIKLLVRAETTADKVSEVTERIRDIIRSIEIDTSKL